MKVVNDLGKRPANAVCPLVNEHVNPGHALRERLKEITCLYEIRRGLGPELSVDNVCQQIFEHLIPAMQFPEFATAVIELDGRCFTSKNHGQGRKHELNSKINANNELCGQLRVFYPEDTPFLVPEEQRLIDAVASDLERWLERKHLEQTLVSIAEENQRSIGQDLHDTSGNRLRRLVIRPRRCRKKCPHRGVWRRQRSLLPSRLKRRSL